MQSEGKETEGLRNRPRRPEQALTQAMPLQGVGGEALKAEAHFLSPEGFCPEDCFQEPEIFQ